MALGTLGSTLNDELNRLANGGTYRDMDDMVDEALAAKQWANRENIIPYSTDTVGILNEIAGLGLDKRNWLDFNGVCNYIAGTTGLPAAAALRQVYPTTDLLTSQASYYVDALYPTGLTSTPGYVYLNGVAGNNITSPDSSALDITGDIDIRVRVALDDWTPAANLALISKWNTNGNQRSYDLRVQTTGVLQFLWSTDGSVASQAVSTVATGLTDGTVKWIRVTFDVNNGAGGNDAKFYTSDDAVTWTQLGTTVTAVGAASIFNSTAQLEIGSDSLILNPAAGKFYRAQVLNGIDGTVVFDANMANVSQTATSFTESSSNAATVTINGFRAYPQSVDNLGAAGSLLPTTVGSSTAADSNDPKFLDHTGTNYVYVPGSLSNNLLIPDAANLDITGDIDVRCQIALDDWTPSASQDVLSKWGAAGNYSWVLRVTSSTGIPTLFWSNDGTTILSASATVAPTIADGATLWLRATLDVDNGASGRDIKFFTSTNGTTWTQLGTTVTQANTTSIFASTADVGFGNSSVSTTNTAGKLFRAQIFNGIDGTKVLDVDTSVITAGSATSFTAVTGQTVTINRSTSGRKTVAVTQPTWLFGTDDYMEVNNRYMSYSAPHLYLPGVSGNFANTPDSAALDITGDIDLRVKVALDDWTPGATSGLLCKSDVAADAYSFFVLGSGVLQCVWIDSTGTQRTSSSAAPNIADGTIQWVRFTLDVDNGLGGYTGTFFKSTDGVNWTQISQDVTTAGTTNIRATSASLQIGTQRSASNLSRGDFYRAQIRNGIDGTVVFDANFESSITSLNQTTFTESSANAATVTINRSGSTYRSAGITAAGYLYPGATNTFTASATDFLNFGAADSFTVLAVAREWANPVSYGFFVEKRNSGSSGWSFLNSVSSNRPTATITDGTNTVDLTTPTTPNWTLGSLFVTTLIVDRNAKTIGYSINTTKSVTASISSVGSVSTTSTMTIGKRSYSSTLFNDMEVTSIAIFRSLLTDAQLRQITNYFANREVYL